MAEQVYKFIDSKRDTQFTRLPNARLWTTVIHTIGKIIAGQRQKTTHAEVANNMLLNTDQINHHSDFYVYTQDILIDLLRKRYGSLGSSVMKICIDDKVRVAGLLMTKETLREYLPDLTGRARGGDRQALDGSRARRNAGLQLLHTNFNNSGEMVQQ